MDSFTVMRHCYLLDTVASYHSTWHKDEPINGECSRSWGGKYHTVIICIIWFGKRGCGRGMCGEFC